MKKLLCVLSVVLAALFIAACGQPEEYILNERTFFKVMTNLRYYPDEYMGKNIEYDCFTYTVTDTDGNDYLCGVRHCSGGYGCQCGDDTVIGFFLDYDEGQFDIPVSDVGAQSDKESREGKKWIHLKGKLKNKTMKEITIVGTRNPTEVFSLHEFEIESFYELSEEQYSKLAVYVTT